MCDRERDRERETFVVDTNRENKRKIAREKERSIDSTTPERDLCHKTNKATMNAPSQRLCPGWGEMSYPAYTKNMVLHIQEISIQVQGLKFRGAGIGVWLILMST